MQVYNVGSLLPAVSAAFSSTATGSEANHEYNTPRTVKIVASSEYEIRSLERQGMNLTLGEEQMAKAVGRAIKALEGPQTAFEMKYHDTTNAIIIKVLNKETGELIREIPPEKTLEMVAKMMEFAGLLIDERV
ncbi:flagellar protein FlaG [Paenibacillus sambharensis]|uniref:flagellar protein FlaG n=1 Tax=Paenibacillus sambharensis TaxID=1803190 RepID=UPI001FE2BCE3|nr:flagellar protein FlaG [Paenibacillus sambharensis]